MLCLDLNSSDAEAYRTTRKSGGSVGLNVFLRFSLISIYICLDLGRPPLMEEIFNLHTGPV